MTKETKSEKEQSGPDEKQEEDILLNEQLVQDLKNYLNNLECLKIMFESVIPTLEEQDQDRIGRIEEIMEEAENSSPDDELVLESHSDVQSLTINLQRLQTAQKLFRFHSVVAVVARFDQFMRQLLTVYFREDLNRLKSSKRNFSWLEILEENSRETVVYNMLEERIENIMRKKSHPQQVRFIDQKLGLGVEEEFSGWDEFIEISQRRHLFVHTGGTVTAQYIKNYQEFGVDMGNVSEGDELHVSDEYFENAFYRFFDLGLRLGQKVYRELFDSQEELKFADYILNNLGYRLLKAEDWELAEFVFDYATQIPDDLISKESEYKYMFIVNLCIARKHNGKEIEDILGNYSWAPLHPKFKLARLTLLEEYDKAADLMVSSVAKEEIPKEYFEEWPLFYDFRKTDQFKEAYKEVFNESYKVSYTEH